MDYTYMWQKHIATFELNVGSIDNCMPMYFVILYLGVKDYLNGDQDYISIILM